MGCNNCNQNQQNNTAGANIPGVSNMSTKLGQLTADDYQGHFFLKVITFLLLLIGIPLIILVLVFQVFGTFFLPTSLASVKKRFSNWTNNAITSYAAAKQYKSEMKRKKQFQNNPTYGDGISDIDVYEDIDDTTEDMDGTNKEPDEN